MLVALFSASTSAKVEIFSPCKAGWELQMRLLSSLAILATAAASASAAILYDSSLKTPELLAGNLVGQDGWVAHNGGGSVPIQVGASGITLAQGSGTREDANVPITAISAGKTYYFGADVVVSGGSTAVYFAHFKDAGAGTDFTTRTFVTPFSGSDFTFGLSAAGSAADVTWASGLTFGTTYRVVGSYAADTQQVKLWVNPATEASTSISFTDPAANAVAAFAFRQGSGNSTQVISNLIVADTFAEAAVPEPTTLGLLGLGALAMGRRRR
jgi:hypothetical protein